jgi:hypothetical protein
VFLEAPVASAGVRFLQLSPGEFFFTTLKVSKQRGAQRWTARAGWEGGGGGSVHSYMLVAGGTGWQTQLQCFVTTLLIGDQGWTYLVLNSSTVLSRVHTPSFTPPLMYLAVVTPCNTDRWVLRPPAGRPHCAV